jgi:D-glucosaminate-6-phosphate ammonia-lyase
MDIYEELGVRTLINARGYATLAGGNRLPPEVLEAMRQAAGAFVRIEDLQRAASRVIAEITGAEAGYVTCGAAAAVALGTAACMTGADPVKMNRLPETTGMKHEVIIQRSHRNPYDHAVRAVGAKLVEIGFVDRIFPYELAAAITPQTAAVFVDAALPGYALPLEQVIDIAHAHEVPVIVDAAAELPPPENLRRFIALGADLVAFSGGKALRGPQASGFLCGRQDLIDAVALQNQDMDVIPETWSQRREVAAGLLIGPPHHGIGRTMKVGKEEIVGLITALKLYEKRDHAAEKLAQQRIVQGWVERLGRLRGLTVEAGMDHRGVPMAHLTLDVFLLGMTAVDVVNQLAEGEPMILVRDTYAPQGRISLDPQCLEGEEADRLARRLEEILGGTARRTGSPA